MKIQMFWKIFQNHNTQHNFFFTHLLEELAKVFSVCVQYVASWSAVIQDRSCFLKQTLRQAHKMHAAKRLTEQDSSVKVKNTVNSQP